MIDEEKTCDGVPAQYLRKLDQKIDLLVDVADNPEDGWEFIFEKEGMTARKKPGDKLMVRADAKLAFDAQSIFNIVIDNSKLPLINPQVDRAKRVKEFSPHTFTQNILFKQVWPTAARDMVNMTHWRVLKSGRIVVVSFNCEEYHEKDAACKVEKGVVRADLNLGGYVLTPTDGGTKITYCVCSDLRGNIPTSVSNTVLRKQPLIVTSIQKQLRLAGKPVPQGGSPDPIDIYSQAFASAKSMLVFNVKDKTKVSSSSLKSQNGAKDNDMPEEFEEDDDNSMGDISLVTSVPLLLPFLIHYLCQSQLWTLVATLAIIPYAYKKLIVDPLTAGSIEQDKFIETPPGRIIIKLAPELEGLLKFVGEKRNELGGIEFSLTHVVV